jgi:hypothetical protein
LVNPESKDKVNFILDRSLLILNEDDEEDADFAEKLVDESFSSPEKYQILQKISITIFAGYIFKNNLFRR